VRPNADYWIKKLQLTPHIEGGAFREVYRSPLSVPAPSLPILFQGDRSICTAIYFLLQQGQFSAFHRIASDEIWHFYSGDPLLIHEIGHNGSVITHSLGSNPEAGQKFFTVIKAGSWFASIPANGSEYSLMGCTVAPGFDFADFELAERTTLSDRYPEHAKLIHALTRIP
jgi:uncharacterized protein